MEDILCSTPKHIHISAYTCRNDREIIKAYTCYISELMGLPIEDVSDELTKFIQTMVRKHYDAYLKSYHWMKISTTAKKDAGYMCNKCGGSRKLSAHHKTYEHIGFETPDDIEVLCGDCHNIKHNWRSSSDE
jgi:hypothetical protein